MNGRRIFRGTINALIHMIHVYLVDDADMPDSLRHNGVNSGLDRFFVMAR